jgi:hypothetical protein
MKKLISLIVILTCQLSEMAIASTRTDAILLEVTQEQMKDFQRLQSEIIAGQEELEMLERDLIIASKKHVGHEFLFKTRHISGLTTIIAATSGMMFMFTPFPYEVALGSGILTLVSGTAFVASEVGIILTPNETTQLRVDIQTLKNRAEKRKKELKKIIAKSCEAEPRQLACY